MTLLSDPEVVEIMVRECGEPLIDMRGIEALRLDLRLADSRGVFALLRVGVVDRLVNAQTLLPPELRFLVIEGYRPVDLQTRYFRAHLSQLRTSLPEASEVELYWLASRYIAPPEVAPHVAGAAVDLTLCTVDGVELWMGSEVNNTDTTACHTDSEDITEEAKANRMLLISALSAAGLVNYPTEWWHWSYGDRYWAYRTGADHARYSAMTVPQFGQTPEA